MAKNIIGTLDLMLDWGMQLISQMFPRVQTQNGKFRHFVKYLISGGSAAFVNLLAIYIFTDIFHIWYLTSAILAFICAFFVSFFLQKFWTFEDVDTSRLFKQGGTYLSVAVLNLLLNTALIYLFVDLMHLHYLAAQFVTSGLIAFESYFVSKLYIFKREL